MATEASEEDRLLVKDGFKHYRRHYSLGELRWGLLCGLAMLGIAGWIAWRGARPDPELFDDGTKLLEGDVTTGGLKVALDVPAPKAGPGAPTIAADQAGTKPAAQAAAGADRGPLPADLAGAGWREDKVAQFDPENLYVKINGRADFFKAFGFKRLYSTLLINEASASDTIDVEMYDLARGPNALGAYGGERGANVKPEVTDTGFHHIDRNALYLARGPYYIRVIGSDETPAIKQKLGELSTKLQAGVKGEALPWAYGLFVGGLGLDTGQVSYYAEAAFSFGFAKDVWAARPAGKDSDLEIFVTALASPAAAKKRATEFGKGFLEIGEPAGKVGAVALAKDKYLNTFSAAAATERWVYGVRGATDKDAAQKELERLQKALVQLPAEVKDRARPAAAVPGGKGGKGDGEHE